MILITGATGRTGAEAAQQLAKQGVPVRVLVRNADKATQLKDAGIDIAVGDASDATAVQAALRGVSKLAVILSNGERQLAMEKQLADLAAEAGVGHVLKVSSVEARAGAHNPVHITHWESEQHVRAVSKAWTIVRPSFYLQNFLSNAPTIKAEGKFYYPFGEKGAAVMTDSRDVGKFIAHVFTTAGHEGQSYDVTSPDLLKFSEVAALFSKELGRPITYVPQDPADYRAMLGRFVKSPWHLDAVCGIFAEIAAGYTAKPTDTFKRVTGQEPMTTAGFIREFRAVFVP